MRPEAPDRLLSAMLDEDAAFHRATLVQTLALAVRRRRVRFASRAFAVSALLAGVTFLLRPPTPAPVPEPVAAPPSLRVVRTRPALFATIMTQPENFTRIATRTSAPMLDYLDDRQLLAAFPGEHPALVAPGTPEARLVFY